MVLDRCIEVMPNESVPYNYFVLPIAEGYYQIGLTEKGRDIMETLFYNIDQDLQYFFSMDGKRAKQLVYQKEQSLALMQRIYQVTDEYDQDELSDKAYKTFQLIMISIFRVLKGNKV